MKTKKWLPLLLAGLMTVSVFGFAACDNGGNKDDNSGTNNEQKDPNKDKTDQSTTDKWNNEGIWLSKDPLVPTDPVSLPTEKDNEDRTTDVSVHDPSIFRDPAAKGTQYYAFGTHFAVAMSYDLIEWEQLSTDNHWENLYDVNEGTVTYAGKQWPKALDETLKIVQPTSNGNDTISTTWAPDVEYYNGTYYMYYSITKAFGSNESAIGRVEAKSPMGPYSNNQVILSSVGVSGDHPNCIDSELFYDKEGKLWMVYGSHFAGVYIKELYNEGENWGLPKEEGWGKLLWKGGGQVVEGPYVFYNATNDYYYLMTTYGALMTTYNMRVARSKDPDGPYVDAEGTDLATSSNNGSVHGNVVAGNFKFSAANGYAAMGHNSVIKDKNGRYFVIYHVRRQSGQTGVTSPHNLYVSQLYFNEDGWPVMSPNAYVGEKAGTVETSDVAGDYEIVLHSTATTQTFVNSEVYTLKDDGTVTKGTANVGTWELKQNFYIDITIDSTTYKGVVAPGWDMYSNMDGVLGLTAISDKGYSLWGLPKQ